jgi:dinuclear metal center YbgI/SA1388 family protein
MTIRDVANYLEEIAPLNYAEDFDNVGLLVGNYATEVNGILVTLDTLEETVDEAIAKDCNLIVSFHPIIFSGLKKLNGNNYVERVVLKAIKNDIAIYATHTALDNSKVGVSAKMGEVLGLQNTKILLPKKNIIKKLTTYAPKAEAASLRAKLFEVGAGNIGNYSEASFNFDGVGTFKGNEASNPSIGQQNVQHQEEETCIQVIFEAKDESAVVNALLKNHSYEEVAYQIVSTENVHQDVGMGMIGELPEEMSEIDFLNYAKMIFNTGCVKHSALRGKSVKKVAVLGGSGAFAISKAIRQKADVYISADFKYHDFFKAEGKILLADVGHYESEQFTKNLLVEYLTKKISSFAPRSEKGKIILSEKSTNPIYYL